MILTIRDQSSSAPWFCRSSALLWARSPPPAPQSVPRATAHGCRGAAVGTSAPPPLLTAGVDDGISSPPRALPLLPLASRWSCTASATTAAVTLTSPGSAPTRPGACAATGRGTSPGAVFGRAARRRLGARRMPLLPCASVSRRPRRTTPGPPFRLAVRSPHHRPALRRQGRSASIDRGAGW